jgi:hypothetical protein
MGNMMMMMMQGIMDADYFTAEYRSLLEDVQAINPAVALDRRTIVHLFDRHQALFHQLRSQSELRNSIRLYALDSRVFAAMMQKMAQCMRAAAAAPAGDD